MKTSNSNTLKFPRLEKRKVVIKGINKRIMLIDSNMYIYLQGKAKVPLLFVLKNAKYRKTVDIITVELLPFLVEKHCKEMPSR